MGQGIILKSERNNPWFKPWFNILLHTQSIVYAKVKGQCLEYSGYITLAKLKILWHSDKLCSESASKISHNLFNRSLQLSKTFGICWNKPYWASVVRAYLYCLRNKKKVFVTGLLSHFLCTFDPQKAGKLSCFFLA